jgi:hypothetical protein
MPRVAYITCDTPAWYDIAVNMAREEDWQPVYWIADRPAFPALRERFPDLLIHERFEAYHLNSPPELAGMEIEPLDEPFLRDMADAETIAIKMMDIVDSGDVFGFNDRRRFFRQRLAYWRAIVKALEIDIAVFGFSAHVVYDYCAYALCRYYGIRTVMFEATFNFALLFAMEDPMVGSTEIAQVYRRLVAEDDGGPIELPPVCDKYLEKLKGKYADAMPWYMKQQFDSFPAEIAAKLYKGEQDQRGAPIGPQTETGEQADALMRRMARLFQRRRRPR